MKKIFISLSLVFFCTEVMAKGKVETNPAGTEWDSSSPTKTQTKAKAHWDSILPLFSLASLSSSDCLDCDKGLLQDGWVLKVQKYLQAGDSEICQDFALPDNEDNEEPPRCDLQPANLQEADLRLSSGLIEVNLQDVNFKGAKVIATVKF